MRSPYYAIDPPNTFLREDAFRIETDPETGVRVRLTVAVALPPVTAVINKDDLILNLEKENTPAKMKPRFFERSTSSSECLQEKEYRDVVFATYSLQSNGDCIGEISVGQITIVPYTYDEFEALTDFPAIKEAVEAILVTDPYIFELYSSKKHTKHWSTSASPSNLLVDSMMSLFNRTCSTYAVTQGVRTIKRYNDETKLGYHRYANFSGPFRKASAFINLQNIYAVISQEPKLPFSREVLSGLGVAIQITT